jgi:hypothetical protein
VTDSSSSQNAVEFTTKNFALVSGTIALVAYLVGTVFLYSYLSFFDWRLIWLVEYADVIKFGLVAFACLSSFGTLFWIFGVDAARFRKEKGRTVGILIVMVGLILLATLVPRIWYEQRTFPEPQYAFWMLTFASIFATFTTIMVLSHTLSRFAQYSLVDGMGDAILVLTTASVLGLTLAVWVRDTDGFQQDVTVNNQIMEKVGVIFLSSHHTVLYANKLATIVPTGSITRIQERKPWPRVRYSDLEKHEKTGPEQKHEATETLPPKLSN